MLWSARGIVNDTSLDSEMYVLVNHIVQAVLSCRVVTLFHSYGVYTDRNTRNFNFMYGVVKVAGESGY